MKVYNNLFMSTTVYGRSHTHMYTCIHSYAVNYFIEFLGKRNIGNIYSLSSLDHINASLIDLVLKSDSALGFPLSLLEIIRFYGILKEIFHQLVCLYFLLFCFTRSSFCYLLFSFGYRQVPRQT